MSKENLVETEQTALLNELIEQQNVRPVYDIDDLSRLWPGEDDPDELLEYLLAEREARRRLHPTERP
ncbi:MAG TPA: hypothetical protein VI756_12545 [Blastocatellia bacterium]